MFNRYALCCFPEVIMKNVCDVEKGDRTSTNMFQNFTPSLYWKQFHHCLEHWNSIFISSVSFADFFSQAYWFIYPVASPHLGIDLWECITGSCWCSFLSNPTRFPSPWRLCSTTSTPSPPASERWSSRRETGSSVRKRTSPDRWRTSCPGKLFSTFLNTPHGPKYVDV